jgi:hypothetical protein
MGMSAPFHGVATAGAVERAGSGAEDRRSGAGGVA